MLKADLGRARAAWIEEAAKDEEEVKWRQRSNFLAYKDADGRYADFHALRHTFITNMVKAGVSPKAAQSLARHSTIDLTMNVYTSLTVNDQASAPAHLPPIPALGGPKVRAGALRATGTDGPEKVPTVVPRGAEKGAVLPASPALEIARDCTETSGGSVEATRLENARNPDKNGVSCGQAASACIGFQSGEGGIRTLGTLASTPVFETGPIGRSGTSPRLSQASYARVGVRVNRGSGPGR